MHHDVSVQEEQSDHDTVSEPGYSDSDMSDIFSIEIQRVVSQAFDEEQCDETSDTLTQHEHSDLNVQVSHQEAQPGPSSAAVPLVTPPDPEVVQQFDPLVAKGATGGESDSSSDNPDMEDEQLERMRIFVNRFYINQSRRPRRGDLVSYFDSEYEDWITVRIIGTNKKTSKHRNYFNIEFLDLDCENDGIYLCEGDSWTFGRPVIKDPAHDNLPNYPLMRRRSSPEISWTGKYGPDQCLMYRDMEGRRSCEMISHCFVVCSM